MKGSKTAEAYFKACVNWQAEILSLREIFLSTDLIEEIKWGAPCYTFAGKNVVGLIAFKNYFGIWFHQGVLLADKRRVLINAQEGKTKALRQWRMTSMNQIDTKLIKAYLEEAVDLVKAGKSIAPNRKKPLNIPPELSEVLARNKDAHACFDKLKPSLKREYADYIFEAKQVKTKHRRLDKILPMIMRGEGLNDKYR
ncbi:MAG: YdeI/OmpD-associated family protein [Robiginitomaculum sp.]|nr:YdeI/OmpD-associated family protein [Robiginitomaculum sp.]